MLIATSAVSDVQWVRSRTADWLQRRITVNSALVTRLLVLTLLGCQVPGRGHPLLSTNHELEFPCPNADSNGLPRTKTSALLDRGSRTRDAHGANARPPASCQLMAETHDALTKAPFGHQTQVGNDAHFGPAR